MKELYKYEKKLFGLVIEDDEAVIIEFHHINPDGKLIVSEKKIAGMKYKEVTK